MFLINSRRAVFCCIPANAGQGISQNLRPDNLPSSLTIFLPNTLVYSTYPPVLVLVRISCILTATLFLDTWVNSISQPKARILFVLHFKTKKRICQFLLARHLNPEYHFKTKPTISRHAPNQTNTRKDRNINR